MILPDKKKSRVAKIPSVPVLKSLSAEDQRELQRWMYAVTENIQVGDRTSGRGGFRDKNVTINDLIRLGFKQETLKDGILNPYSFDINNTPIERYEAITIHCNDMIFGSTNQADYVSYRGGLVAGFDTSADEYAYFVVTLPNSWKAGTDILPVINFTIPTDDGDKDVAWVLSYSWANPNDTVNFDDFPAATTDSNVITIQTGTYVNMLLRNYDFAAIAGNGMKNSSTLICSIMRDVSEDDYGYDALLLSMDFLIKKDKRGFLQKDNNKRG